MPIVGKRVVVTGGAGFIGSHIVDRLMSEKCEVTVVDNLSSGDLRNLSKWSENPRFRFMLGDLLEERTIETLPRECEIVFHLAANPEVRVGTRDPRMYYEQNVLATFGLLEWLRRSSSAKTFVFTSTSTIYGEASQIPTPEDYGPLCPISIYGASKLACESLISAYSHSYGLKAIIFRMANIVGSRSRHGVLWDFITKLRLNRDELEVLGDGRQRKSYLLVEDCIDGIFAGLEASANVIAIFNVGSTDQVDVATVAKAVADEMGLREVRLRFKDELEGGRGWIGDVRNMLLDVSRLMRTGWSPRHSSLESVREATRRLLSESAQ